MLILTFHWFLEQSGFDGPELIGPSDQNPMILKFSRINSVNVSSKGISLLLRGIERGDSSEYIYEQES